MFIIVFKTIIIRTDSEILKVALANYSEASPIKIDWNSERDKITRKWMEENNKVNENITSHLNNPWKIYLHLFSQFSITVKSTALVSN